MKVKATRIYETGGPEVLRYEDIDLPEPGPKEARIRHTAIGLNFIDIYHRSGLYPVPLPSGLGIEAAGIIEATGDQVTTFKPGDRVAYGNSPVGAYSQAANVRASLLSKIPDSISDQQAGTIMVKGMTVRYLFKETYKVKAGETILFHAAAGGVGLIACQWAKHLGINMIGTVGSEEKAEIARAHGCAHVINYRTENIVDRVKELTGGKGVPVVYDGVGKDTFLASLDCLQPRGLLASFGNASGPIDNFDLGLLAAKGSLYVTRPTLMHYTASPADLSATANDLFDVVTKGIVKNEINQTYKLADAARGQADLAARRTTGASLLIP